MVYCRYGSHTRNLVYVGVTPSCADNSTEFSLCDGKVYLSPMIDLYDECHVNWKIGISPNKDMVTTMLNEFKKIVPKDTKSTIHTDRCWHYRVADWIMFFTCFVFLFLNNYL